MPTLLEPMYTERSLPRTVYVPTGVGYSARPIEAGSTPGSPQCGRGGGVGTADGGPASMPSMRTVKVCAERSATPITAAPVANSVLNRPMDREMVLCAGQNRSGPHCPEVASCHSYFPVIAGEDVTSTACSAAS